jgi:hypothetical protein
MSSYKSSHCTLSSVECCIYIVNKYLNVEVPGHEYRFVDVPVYQKLTSSGPGVKRRFCERQAIRESVDRALACASFAAGGPRVRPRPRQEENHRVSFGPISSPFFLRILAVLGGITASELQDVEGEMPSAPRPITPSVWGTRAPLSRCINCDSLALLFARDADSISSSLAQNRIRKRLPRTHG